MPQDSLAVIKAREDRVKAWNVEQATIKRQQEARYTTSREAVLLFLSKSRLDYIIRQVIKEKGLPYHATKLVTNEVPLDGNPETKYPPAFVLDHTGQWGYSRRREYPGLRYSFRVMLDQTVISVTICRSESGNLFPYFFITHEDGRSHQVDWQVSFANPSDDQLTTWLRKELNK